MLDLVGVDDVRYAYAVRSGAPLPSAVEPLLELLARKRGCLVSGGRVDLEKVSRLLISELRAGELGGICLETPAGFAAEGEQVIIERARKAAAKEARKTRRRKK